ncbi:MAG: EAL domain-containing protein, partial [Sphingomonas sp.]
MAITMAFQPVVDIESGAVFAYEALVRGADEGFVGEDRPGLDVD